MCRELNNGHYAVLDDIEDSVEVENDFYFLFFFFRFPPSPSSRNMTGTPETKEKKGAAKCTWKADELVFL